MRPILTVQEQMNMSLRSPSLIVAGAMALCAIGCAAGPPVPLSPPAPGPVPSTVSTELRVLSVSPVAGRSAEQTFIRIHGAGFEPGAIVAVDGVAVSGTVVSPDIIQAMAPAHSPGAIDVIVTNPNGRSSHLERAFTYVTELAPPGGIAIGPDVSVTGVLGDEDGICTGESVACRAVRVQGPPDAVIEVELISLDGRNRIGVYTDVDANAFLAPTDFPRRSTVTAGHRLWVMGEFALFRLTARHRDSGTPTGGR
jgi:hypothetical protein